MGQRGGDHLGGVGVIPQVGCGGLLGELGDPGAQGLGVGHRGNGGVGVSESFDLSGEVSGHGGESTAEPARGAVGADSGSLDGSVTPTVVPSSVTHPSSMPWAWESSASSTARVAGPGSVRVDR